MGAIVPLPVYSQQQHITASDLIHEMHACIQTLFPIGAYDGEEKVSAFLQYHSSGKGLLILGNALAFSPLRNVCDPLREVSPVLFDCAPRNCSRELFNAITTHGRQIPGSPELIAIEVDITNAQPFSVDPQHALACLIRGEIPQIWINSFRLQITQDSWLPPVGNPTWQGLAFERTDLLFRSWLHEANPNALQGARDDAQRHIDEVITARDRKVQERARHIAAGRFQGPLQEKIERELDEIAQVLHERQNFLAYLTAQTVNSASQPTLQCNMALVIDDPGKVKLLHRTICQAIANTVDQALGEVSWDVLGISFVAIDNLIRQKLNTLIEKVDILIQYQGRAITDWKDFKENTLADKIDEFKLTYEGFCTRRLGHPEPTDEERPEIDRLWKEKISKRLKWMTSRLKMVDDQLKMVEHFAFTETDISIFESHRERMIQVLKRTNSHTYGLGLELAEKYAERNLVRNAARSGNSVLLVKRISETGHMLFGVTRLPTNPSDRPDPNGRKDEAHIPLKTVRMPIFGAH